MSARLVVLYDANVLYPAQLRDLLIRLAVGGLVRAHWTDAIHEEWIRNVLADYPDITREELRRTRRLIEQALPAARIEGYEHHISSLSLPDPDDRHILAAAIEIGADAIVTFNLDDFPASRLDPHGISAIHPDAFVSSLYEENPGAVIEVMRRHRASLRKPPKSATEYCQILRRARLEETAQAIGERMNEL